MPAEVEGDPGCKLEPSRRLMHTRQVICHGYHRSDDLWDIEATLTDTKPFPITLIERQCIASEEPIHEMTLCLTIDRKLLIHAVGVRVLNSPYTICPYIATMYQQLVGMRIESGFSQAVRRMFRGVQGCTHLTELLGPLATTAFQTLWSEIENSGEPLDTRRELPSYAVGGCHALREDGPIARKYARRS